MTNELNRDALRLAKEALLGRLVPDLVHQIRNPLNSILTSAELLEEDGQSDELRNTLLPVVSRSAGRIRDLLSALDCTVETTVPKEFELRTSLANAGGLLQCRRQTVVIRGPQPGAPIALAGPYDALWVLLLCVFEDSLCAAKEQLDVVVNVADTVRVEFRYDGASKSAKPKGSQEFVLDLARSLGADVYYAADEPATVLSFLRAARVAPEVQQ